MAFHETRFPAAISFGSTGGVERRTEIVELVNGFEERNSPWARSRRRFDAGLGVRSLDDLASVLAFFEARQARLHGFRWRDWLDHKSCAPSEDPTPGDQVVPGAGPVRQLVKTYADGPSAYDRPIAKPVEGSVRVAVDGVELALNTGFQVDETSGVLTLASDPGAGTVTAGFEFDVPVRFDSDSIEVNLAAFEAGDVPAIPIIEVRL